MEPPPDPEPDDGVTPDAEVERHMSRMIASMRSGRSDRPAIERVGRYRVLGELGRGGMGTVLEALDEELDRRIAIKVLHGRADAHHTERLRREARALARLSHPNVVQVHEVGEADGRWFIAMELVPGDTLDRWQMRRRRGWRECVSVYRQAGEGLAAAHSAGLVHRDFKPSNCIIDERGRVRVLDFGLVRDDAVVTLDQEDVGEDVGEDEDGEPEDADEGARGRALTRSGTVLGTVAYMPLEQLEGRTADARSDQFSFCASLYEALYGERPHPHDSIARTMLALRADEIRPPRRGVSVPARLRRALVRGLSRDPDARWPSMTALLVELRSIERRRQRLRLAALSSVAVGVAVTGWLVRAPEPEPEPCVFEDDPFALAWNDEERRALLALPKERIDGSAVAARLDELATHWGRRRRSLCLGHHQGEIDDERHALEQACLRRGVHRVEVWLDVVGDPRVEAGAGVLASLDGLEASFTCADEGGPTLLPEGDDPELGDAIYDAIDEAHVALGLGAMQQFHDRLVAVPEELGDLSGAPKHALWWRLQLAQSLEHLDRFDEAETELRRILVEAEADPDAWKAMRGGAMAHLAAILAQRPEKADAAELMARTAMAALSDSRGGSNHIALARLALALAVLHGGDAEQALELAEAAADDPLPRTAPLAHDLYVAISVAQRGMVEALALERLGRGKEAAEVYRRSLAAMGWTLGASGVLEIGRPHPLAAQLLHNFGVLARRQRWDAGAESLLRHAAELRESLGSWHAAGRSWSSLALGLAHRDLDLAMLAFGRAESDLRRAGAERELLELWFNQGVALQLAGELPRARDAYAQVLQAPDVASMPRVGYGARVGRGTVLVELGEPAAARRDLEQALAHEPDGAVAYDRAELRWSLAKALAAERDAESLAASRRWLAEAKTLARESPELLASIEAWSP